MARAYQLDPGTFATQYQAGWVSKPDDTDQDFTNWTYFAEGRGTMVTVTERVEHGANNPNHWWKVTDARGDSWHVPSGILAKFAKPPL